MTPGNADGGQRQRQQRERGDEHQIEAWTRDGTRHDVVECAHVRHQQLRIERAQSLSQHRRERLDGLRTAQRDGQSKAGNLSHRRVDRRCGGLLDAVWPGRRRSTPTIVLDETAQWSASTIDCPTGSPPGQNWRARDSLTMTTPRGLSARRIGGMAERRFREAIGVGEIPASRQRDTQRREIARRDDADPDVELPRGVRPLGGAIANPQLACRILACQRHTS